MGIIKHEISVRGISFHRGKRQILFDVSKTFEAGKLHIILGRNGSGKSTLLRLMAGLLKPSGGEVVINDRTLTTLSIRQRAETMAFLPQHHRAVFPFCVKDVVLTGRSAASRFRPDAQDQSIAADAMALTGIIHLSDRDYTSLSGGEQQLVMLARILAQQPSILLLDEPTTGLDLSNQSRMLSLLKSLAQKDLCVVAVLHDPMAAFAMGDTFTFISNGHLVVPDSNGPLDEAFLSDIFQTPMRMVQYGQSCLITPDFILND